MPRARLIWSSLKSLKRSMSRLWAVNDDVHPFRRFPPLRWCAEFLWVSAEDDGRQGARPQNHHNAQDKLSTDGRATIACLAGSASGVHHATEATPAMVVILWGCSKPLGTLNIGSVRRLGNPRKWWWVSPPQINHWGILGHILGIFRVFHFKENLEAQRI